MKQEDKYIDYLFESVREEDPQLSFEEVAEVFSTSTSPTLFGLAKGWFLKNINLNSVLFLSAGILGIITVFLFSSSNNSSEDDFIKNPIVTNQLQESSSSKDISFEIKSEVPDIFARRETKNLAIKNIKPKLNFSKSKIQNQKFNKNLLAESPILHSISPQLKLEKSLQLSLSTYIKNIKKEKTFSGNQPKYKTVDEVISPWVVGQKSEMPWQITRKTKIPILNETERVLQQFMDTKYLEQVFEKEENGYFKPLKMLVHYSIDENYFIHFKGKKIRLLNEKVSPDFDPTKPFIDVKRFRIKKSKAYFNFIYKDYQVQMQLRHVGEGWKRHKLKVKNNKEVKVNMTF